MSLPSSLSSHLSLLVRFLEGNSSPSLPLPPSPPPPLPFGEPVRNRQFPHLPQSTQVSLATSRPPLSLLPHFLDIDTGWWCRVLQESHWLSPLLLLLASATISISQSCEILPSPRSSSSSREARQRLPCSAHLAFANGELRKWQRFHSKLLCIQLTNLQLSPVGTAQRSVPTGTTSLLLKACMERFAILITAPTHNKNNGRYKVDE